jgi:hypothetical protein
MTDVLPPANRAVVSDGATETWYLRAGAGPAVLVLSADAERRAGLLRSLAAHARVTAPEPPRDVLDDAPATARQSRLSTWLRGFLDGLGVLPFAIVADPTFAIAAREFALAEGDGARSPAVVVADGEATTNLPAVLGLT